MNQPHHPNQQMLTWIDPDNGNCCDTVIDTAAGVVVPTLALTSEKLLAHASSYGTDCVYDTAATHLSAGELALLRVELDRIDRSAPTRGRFAPKPRRRRRSREETLAAAVALRQQGLVIGAIADKLTITRKVVKELLATHRRRQRAAEKAAPPRPPSYVVGCRRCGWWQDSLSSLDAANDALASHDCPSGPPLSAGRKVLELDFQGSESAWLSGENTSETATTTSEPWKPIQEQSSARHQAGSTLVPGDHEPASPAVTANRERQR
jgi:hypothetical protein